MSGGIEKRMAGAVEDGAGHRIGRRRGDAVSAAAGSLCLSGRGADLGAAFAELASQLVGETCREDGGNGEPVELICHGNSPGALLLSWVELLLYAMDARQAAFRDLRVSVQDGKHLRALGRAVPLEGPRRAWPRSVDAQSSHVAQSGPGDWTAECRVTMEEAQA